MAFKRSLPFAPFTGRLVGWREDSLVAIGLNSPETMGSVRPHETLTIVAFTGPSILVRGEDGRIFEAYPYYLYPIS